MTDWQNVDRLISVATAFVLTDEEREQLSKAEGLSYESNLPAIRQILVLHEAELKRRGFWTETQINSEGARFRYSYRGFYGPGGFSSQFHIAGPLVVATIPPANTDPYAAFYSNDLNENIFLGQTFDEFAFRKFISENLMAYLQPENQILSPDDYAFVREAAGRPVLSK